MAAQSTAQAISEDRVISVSRVFNAPRELIWDIWTDPKHITHWWGPEGFSTTTSEMSVTPGGVWRFVMHGPDGTDYLNKIVFIDVKKPSLLSYRHSGEGEHDDVKFTSTVTFADLGGKTEITLRSVFETAELRKFVAEKYGAVEGAHQTLSRFAAYIEKMA